jgi:hypothetical protein
MSSGAVTLGDIAGRIALLEIACAWVRGHEAA